MAHAISEMSVPRVRQVRPVPSFKGTLSIGDPYNFDDALQINVERYPRTKRATAQSATKYVPAKEESQESKESIQGGAVTLQRTYKIKRGEEEIEVDKEELDKAYKYGKTIVNLSEADLESMKPKTYAGLDVL
jgi:ATP-dependent DNA helicase 2 subunit 2